MPKIVYEKPSVIWTNIEERLDATFYKSDYIMELDKKYSVLPFEVKENGELIKELTDYTANGSFASLKANVIYTDNEGIPLIRGKNINQGYLDFGDIKYVTKATYEFLKKSKLEGGELLFTKTGTVGNTIVWSKHYGKATLGDNIFKVIYKNEIDTHYIHMFFMSKYGQKWVERFVQGGVQPTIIKDSFRQIKIPNPPKKIQSYIGDKVRKAEELREEAKRLKEEAEKIFINSLNLSELENQIGSVNRYNWVLLDEDRLDLNYNHPSLATIKNHLVKYKAEKLNVIAEIVGGFAFPSNLFNVTKGNDVIKIAEINEYDIQYERLSKVSVSEVNKDLSKYVCNVGELVYAMTGATIGKTAINISHPLLVNQRVGIIRSKSEVPNGYLLVYFNSLIGKHFSKFLNTGVAQPNISIDDMGEFIVPILEQNLMNQIHNKIIQSLKNNLKSKQLISEAKQDVEDLIEGKFDESKISEGV